MATVRESPVTSCWSLIIRRKLSNASMRASPYTLGVAFCCLLEPWKARRTRLSRELYRSSRKVPLKYPAITVISAIRMETANDMSTPNPVTSGSPKSLGAQGSIAVKCGLLEVLKCLKCSGCLRRGDV
ncbi:uncharacterized protein BDV17DRAFT_267223 [Aspergillus undulatus]|uniref:uncharacterized protein n=1 Tax=Aspergillus undulatus TaxID=1810928 RepID=UPI003CCDD70D